MGFWISFLVLSQLAVFIFKKWQKNDNFGGDLELRANNSKTIEDIPKTHT